MSVILTLWLIGAAAVFVAALRTGQSTGGVMLTAAWAGTWPLWCILVLVGAVIDALHFLIAVLQRPH